MYQHKGRQPAPANERRKETLQAKITQIEKDAIFAEAHRRGRSVSDFVRETVLNEVTTPSEGSSA